ncbi:HNH endonuclease, partial [Roseomonas sp. NAR14]
RDQTDPPITIDRITHFGSATPHVDHYVPLALGGSNDRSNLRLLHAACNLSKGARHPIEHGRSLGLLCW